MSQFIICLIILLLHTYKWVKLENGDCKSGDKVKISLLSRHNYSSDVHWEC